MIEGSTNKEPNLEKRKIRASIWQLSWCKSLTEERSARLNPMVDETALEYLLRELNFTLQDRWGAAQSKQSSRLAYLSCVCDDDIGTQEL